MFRLAFPAPHPPTLPIVGAAVRFPLHRVYCVGRNYAAHAREMGADPDREPPFFFLKPADSVVTDGGEVPYPPRTSNFHHEIELVVAIGRAGRDIGVEAARDHVFGYAIGNDLTRRDLQLASRHTGRPWDTGKSMDVAAVIGAVHPASTVDCPSNGRIWLAVNDELRQQSDLSRLIWSVHEIIAELSTLYTLRPGDLIMTGTPEGVGPMRRGDRIRAGIANLGELTHTIAR